MRRAVAVLGAVLVLAGWACVPVDDGGDPMGMSMAGYAALAAGEDWHYVGAAGEPAFASGYANAGGGTSKTAFRIREGGAVDLYIGATAGPGATVFTLPEGYRPSSDTLASGSGYSFGGSSDSIAVAVLTDGSVQPIVPASTTVEVFTGQFWLTPPAVAP